MTLDPQIIKAIRRVGKLLLKGLKNKRSYTLKEKQHYLTEFDIKADRIIVSAIKKTYPEHNINAEESGIIFKNSKFTWYIDPISNTRNFIHGLPGFAIAVGLIENNKPKLGIVYDPLLDEMFIGKTGKGAYLNGKRIHKSKIIFGEHAFINVDWQKRKGNKEIEEGIKIFSNIGRYCTVRAIGSVALMASYVACGRLDAMVNNYSDAHALVPAWTIIREAGAEILDLRGKVWNLKSTTTFVTNKKVTKGILACLKKS